MTTGPMPAGWKRMRKFPVVRVRDQGGRSHKAEQIKCGECGRVDNHLKRGNQDSKTWFERHGWHVGNSEAHDRCAACIAFKQRKVIKMEDHRKMPPAPEPVKAMSREDARIVWRSIEEHWNEAACAYKPGWSDAKIAADLSAPVAWVATVRERDYGGSGDDPGLAQLIEKQKGLVIEAGTLQGILDVVEERLDKYRDGHRILLDQINRLQREVAAITTPSRKAG